MFPGRRLLEAALIAVPLAWASGGCADMVPPASIRAERPQVEFLSDYGQAQREARRAGKPLLVVIKTDWCPFSRVLLRETFADRAVVDACDRFVCVVIDAEKQPKLCRTLSPTGVYPTVQFFGTNAAVLGQVEGSRTPKELLAAMRSAESALARRPVRARLFR
jgi:thiol:disulfide interchange protein